MWKATKARRASFGFLPIIALVLGYQEVFMSQANSDGGIKNVLLRLDITTHVLLDDRLAREKQCTHISPVRGELVMGQHRADVGRVCLPLACDYSCS